MHRFGHRARRMPAHPREVRRISALEDFFARVRVDEILASTADTLGNPAFDRAIRQAGRHSPVALRVAENLIDASALCTLEEGLHLELAQLVEIFTDPTAQTLLRARCR